MMKKLRPFRQIGLYLGLIASLISCNDKPSWTFDHQITLPEAVRPLGIAKVNDTLWISDPQHFRVLKMDAHGQVLDSISPFQRPMNIASFRDQLYVPEFLTDSIWQVQSGAKQAYPVDAALSGPAGVAVQPDRIAIADFNNHRIVLESEDTVKTLGSKGHEPGQLYYPIDVAIQQDQIFVADAYNHRVQVFNEEGGLQEVIGASDSLKVASGIDVSEKQIAVTSQEQDRVMVYDHKGNLEQALTQRMTYPTDVYLQNDTLYIANFKDNSVSVYLK